MSAVGRGRFRVPTPEIDSLAEELALLGVPFSVEGPDSVIGWHLVYPSALGPVSVVWHDFSYGHALGLLEAMPLAEPPCDPVGWCTAGDVLRMFPPEVAQ